MDPHEVLPVVKKVTSGLSRRTALRRLGGGGVLAALAAIGMSRRSVAAQQAAPNGVTVTWQRLHLEFDVTPANGVTITRAGGGPPQRGDFYHIDAPIFAAGNVNGTEIGRYQCFGTWTHAASDTKATDQRLTSVQYRFADGALMGMINEGGTEANSWMGAIEGGTGKYANASGAFRQIVTSGGVPSIATPGVTPAAVGPGTPAAGQIVIRAVFDLILPVVS